MSHRQGNSKLLSLSLFPLAKDPVKVPKLSRSGVSLWISQIGKLREGHSMKVVSNCAKFSRVLAICLSLLLITSCGSSFSDKDLAACETAWESTRDVISAAPRATYNESAPYPTETEISRYFEDLSDLADEIVELGSSVDSAELGLTLIPFGSSIRLMASEFFVNPLSKGTPGITQFNDSFKAVTSFCEGSGWEN
jgi:hypothetical protein